MSQQVHLGKQDTIFQYIQHFSKLSNGSQKKLQAAREYIQMQLQKAYPAYGQSGTRIVELSVR